ncbi:MAG: ribulose-phosphate 3-epimerase [Aquificaceae bacterium]|nr:ribulose-phosphate 3-epimerase [Aquificaceae bacterium]
MKQLAVSILSADLWRLGEQLQECIEAGADIVHFDVMDGHFVPNITFGPVLLEHIKKHCPLLLDAHLMIDRPERYVKDFISAGADMVSVHIENSPHIHRTLELIKSLGAKAGIAINPATPIDLISEAIYYADFVLLMSVNPGFGGQAFIPRSIERLKKLSFIVRSVNPLIRIEIDGGIKEENIETVAKSGADILVVGSDIFSAQDIKRKVFNLKSILSALT